MLRTKIVNNRHIVKNMNSLNQLLKTYKHIILIISADWCKPCRKLKPLIENRLLNIQNNTGILYMNFSNKDILPFFRKYRIQSIPTIAKLTDGQIVDVIVGSDMDNFNMFFDKYKFNVVR
jgi:thioredoxin 1